jgi:hypothetical protein
MFTGMANKDEALVHKVAEAGFADKLLKSSSQLQQWEYQAPPEDAPDRAYLVDKMFIQGLSHDRHKNDWNVDYLV